MNMRVELTVAYVTWKLLLGRRRWLLAVLANALPVLVAWVFMTYGDSGTPETRQRFFAIIMATAVLTVLLPLSGLIHGTSAFGTELDDGTLRYILAKPVARWRIVLAKLVTAVAATLVSILPGVIISGLVVFGTVNRLLLGFSVAVLLASLLYAALFMLLSLATRRALIIGLLYVIVWEGALSRLFAGTRLLSIREYSMAAADAVGGTAMEALQAALEVGTALPLAAVVLSLTVFATIRRLRSLEVVEEV